VENRFQDLKKNILKLFSVLKHIYGTFKRLYVLLCLHNTSYNVKGNFSL